ncbi:MAG TPA: DUF1016 N-terminal domain-containing protein, partial [Chitinophagaceae bacterium]
MKVSKKKYSGLLKEIRQLVERARNNITRSINTELLATYWNVGKLIVEYEQSGSIRAEYGKQLLIDLSKSLSREIGKGFSRSQLQMMRLFYIRFQPKNKQICLTVSGKSVNRKSLTVSGKSKTGLTVSDQLSWSHYYELLKCNDEMEISFYQQTAIQEGWSVRELRRQMDTALFERIALSKNTKSIKRLAAKGQIIKNHTDITRDPYVLEFLNIPEHHSYTEKHFEQKIIDNLQ